MTKEQVLYSFWNSFQIPAYDENSVPENAPFPRITYESAMDSFGGELALTASIWERSTSWADISAKAETISADITRGGKIIRTDTGSAWIKRGSPFAQRMPGDTDSIRRIVLNITVEFFDQD